MMVKLTAAGARLGRPAGIAVAALLALPAQSAPAQDFPASASFAQLAGTSGCLLQPGFENDEGCARARAVRAATALEVTPDQRQVYVVSGVEPDGSNAIAGFARQQATGALTAAGCVSDAGGDGRVGTDGFCTDGDALRGASDLAITPDGRFVYVVASSSSGVTWFERDATTAALTQRGCLIVFARGDRCGAAGALIGASGVDVSADGAHVYVTAATDGAVTVFGRDQETGALHEVMCVSDTGSEGRCVNGTGLAGASSVVVAADGADVYVTAAASGAVTSYRRDAATGRLSPSQCLVDEAPVQGSCRSAPALAGASDAVLTSDGKQLLVAAESDSALAVFNRDAATGSLEPVQCFTATGAAFGAGPASVEGCGPASALDSATRLAVSRDGRAAFVVSPGDYLAAFQRDPATGRIQQFGCAEQQITYEECFESRNLDDARGLAVSADGRNLYVATEEGVSVFAATIAIVGRTATVRRGAIEARLACPAARARRCAGRLSIAGARAVRAQRYEVRRGRSASVTLRLSARLRRATRRHRRVRVTLVARDAGGLTAASRRRVALHR